MKPSWSLHGREQCEGECKMKPSRSLYSDESNVRVSGKVTTYGTCRAESVKQYIRGTCRSKGKRGVLPGRKAWGWAALSGWMDGEWRVNCPVMLGGGWAAHWGWVGEGWTAQWGWVEVELPSEGWWRVSCPVRVCGGCCPVRVGEGWTAHWGWVEAELPSEGGWRLSCPVKVGGGWAAQWRWTEGELPSEGGWRLISPVRVGGGWAAQQGRAALPLLRAVLTGKHINSFYLRPAHCHWV